jgi:hypothetical protein
MVLNGSAQMLLNLKKTTNNPKIDPGTPGQKLAC